MGKDTATGWNHEHDPVSEYSRWQEHNIRDALKGDFLKEPLWTPQEATVAELAPGAHDRCRENPLSCPTELDMFCTAFESLAEASLHRRRALREETQVLAKLDVEIEEFLNEASDSPEPVALVDLGRKVRPGEGVARDLLLDGQILTIAGEEGDGKTTLITQIGCQLAAGENVCGYFEVSEPVSPVLIVDVEQSEEDAVIVRDDVLARGLKVDGVFWLDANGRSLDLPEDQHWLTDQVREIRPKVLMLDTGTESVSKPQEDTSVKPLFAMLHRLLKYEGVRSVILAAQPRKRAQGELNGRRFDDLFGSRVWKGRSSAVLYLEHDQITVWKQRGSYIRRRWGGRVGRYVRSDNEPARILGPQPEMEAESDRRTQALVAVQMNPDKFSKTSLIEEELRIAGHLRPAWRRTIDGLVAEGVLVIEGRHNRLRAV
jgi:hypothetical protein